MIFQDLDPRKIPVEVHSLPRYLKARDEMNQKGTPQAN